MASGAPYVTWDGREYVVRVDLDPDDARETAYAFGPRDGVFQPYFDAADRCDELRNPTEPTQPGDLS